MKKVIAILIVTMIVLSLPSSVMAVAQTPVGRYQLFQGYLMAYSAKDQCVVKEKAIFKSDTITGKTLKHITGLDEKGKLYQRWVDTDITPK